MIELIADVNFYRNKRMKPTLEVLLVLRRKLENAFQNEHLFLELRDIDDGSLVLTVSFADCIECRALLLTLPTYSEVIGIWEDDTLELEGYHTEEVEYLFDRIENWLLNGEYE